MQWKSNIILPSISCSRKTKVEFSQFDRNEKLTSNIICLDINKVCCLVSKKTT